MTTTDLELVTYAGLDERIIVIRAGEEVDCVFVVTERFNVLVDTLATPALCARALELVSAHIGDRPLITINSHMDWDHFWGNSALDVRTPIIAHSAAIERLRDPDAKQVLAEKQAEEPRFKDVEIVPPTITFSGNTMSLHGGDLTLELMHTPGHTPDHVAVWIPEVRTCLAVDAVEYPIPEVWNQSPENLRKLCASLKQIRDLKPSHVFLAHGQTADPEVVGGNIDYFTKLRDAVGRVPDSFAALQELHERSGFQLEDFVSLPPDMPEDTKNFYREIHKSNFDAVAAAHRAGTDFL
ncbi:MBL fold metallo-hydrolase [Labrenzia sp. R4_1]|uniref:MBL fold metallo-hydrolase n=1 Tax=Labrenzia sp. R4_1 TaxID=2821106 RepID=UPI001ADA62A4|nr:MBL fold metallo-hydrolase [Labrenzia sp. R4_1]MBO9427777.1 MBL fold metallo-hydrolase [Labrenzia sp. R4_1]